MNTPTNTLWKLINRLSPAEKRYYKTHFASSTNRLTKLFDLLNQQSTYDETAAREDLGVSAAQYKVLKAQLQQQLLTSLIAARSKHNIGSSIRIGLEEIDILLERELFAEAEKKLRRLDQLCKRYGFTLYRYEIIQKLQFITHLEFDIRDQSADSYYRQLLSLQRTLNQKQQLHSIQMELEAWTPFTPDRFAFGRRLLHQLESMPAEYLDFQSQLEWMQNIALCHEILGQETQAQRYRQQILDNFAQDAALRERLPFNYLRALRYQAAPLLSAPDLQKLNDSVEAAKKLVAQFPQFNPHLIHFYWAKIQAYFVHHHWSRITPALEDRIHNWINSYQLQQYRVSTDIYFVLACTHLINERHAQAADYLTALERTKPATQDYHIPIFSIIQLIADWESQDYDEFNRRLRNHKRRLARKGILEHSPFTQALFKFFHQLTLHTGKEQAVATSFLLDLSAFSGDIAFPFFYFLHLERWIQALAGGIKWKDTFK